MARADKITTPTTPASGISTVENSGIAVNENTSSSKGSSGTPAFTAAEYDFWYNGIAAPRDLPGITGQVGDIKQGQVRDGGSFFKRSCNYTGWNSFFTENVFQVKRYNDFLSA